MTGPILLLKVANGGWIVKQVPERDSPYSDVAVGAFSNTEDLLGWLTAELPDVATPIVQLDGRGRS